MKKVFLAVLIFLTIGILVNESSPEAKDADSAPAPVDAADTLAQFKRVCTVVYFKTRDEKTSDLTVSEAHLMSECEKFGLYRDNQ